MTISAVGYVAVPVIDPRIETHCDVQLAVNVSEGPVESSNTEPAMTAEDIAASYSVPVTEEPASVSPS